MDPGTGGRLGPYNRSERRPRTDREHGSHATGHRSVLVGDPKEGTVEASETETDWMAAGNCRYEPPATFFPSDGVGVEIAKRICVDCPVKEPCLEYALAHRIDHGVWGGTSERQRRRILKQRRLAGAVPGSN